MFASEFEKVAKNMGLMAGLKAADQTKSLFSKTVKPAMSKLTMPKIAASLAAVGNEALAAGKSGMKAVRGAVGAGKPMAAKELKGATTSAIGTANTRMAAQASQKTDPLAKPLAQRLQERKATGQPTVPQRPGFMSNFTSPKPAQTTKSTIHTQGARPGTQQLPATLAQTQKGMQRAGTMPSPHTGKAGGIEPPKSMPHGKGESGVVGKLTNAPWKRYALAAGGGAVAAKALSGDNQPQQPMLGY